MSRAKNVDVLNGSLLSSIIKFGIPLLLVSLMQSLFHSIDIMVLGQMADNEAVAAVSATGSVVSLLTTVSMGISVGAKIVLARLIGEGVGQKIERTVFTSMATAVILGAVTMIVGISFAPMFLSITKCPESIIYDSQIYMQIYFVAAPAIMIYNFGSNILQVSGDSQRPLYYMMISGGLNIVLNFLLCLVLTQKVTAVAIATAVSQIVGAVLVSRRILTMDGACRLKLKDGRWDWRSFKLLLTNGLPIGFSSALYSLANLQIQTALNSFGPQAIAGNSGSANIEGIQNSIANAPWSATVGVFVGQNVGAGNKKRVRNSILTCMAISVSIGLVMGITSYLLSRPLLSMFVDGEVALGYGRIRMGYLVLFCAVSCLSAQFSNSIQAFGYSLFCTINSIVCVFGFRMLWMNNVYPLCPTFHVLIQCFLISWILVCFFNGLFFFYLYFARFKKGKIKKMG